MCLVPAGSGDQIGALCMTNERIRKTKNRYTKLRNEVLEVLSQINLPPYEWRVLLCILRKTYGWNKKSDFISVSQIAELTGLPRSHACRAKQRLLERNILFFNKGKLGLNKNYNTWSITNTGNKPAIKRKKQGNVTNNGNNVTSTGTTKEKKDTITKEKGKNMLNFRK